MQQLISEELLQLHELNKPLSCVLSVQIHRAREVRAEGARVLHLDVRQVDADRAKDAAPLGRGKHHGKVLKVQENHQELQWNHRPPLSMV